MASEAGHWYKPDGTPAYTIVGKNGQERPTTLRDAKKHGLLPSVTSIIRCASSYGLERWKAEQLLMAGLTLPKREGEPEKDWIARVWEDSKEQARKAAERGTAIHAAVESHYRGIAPENGLAPWVRATADCVSAFYGNPDWSTEKSFAMSGLGFGGKVDLHAPGILIDFKTKDGDLSSVKLWDEHYMQTAAYCMGLGITKPRAAIVFISRTEPVAIAEEVDPAELTRGWDMFYALLMYWKAANL